MVQYKTRAELKYLAKEKLKEKYGASMLACLLQDIISYAVLIPVFIMLELLASAIFTLITGDPNYDYSWEIISYPLQFIGSVAGAMFITGNARFFLNLAHRHTPQISDIFYGFHCQVRKNILLATVIVLITSIARLPVDISNMLSAPLVTKSLSMMQISKLQMVLAILSIIFVIIYFPISFMLSQVFYLSQYYPEYGVKQVIKLSIQIMKGHKWRLFCLNVSFIPMYLLGILSLGIGFLWIIPYVQATQTEFFLDLVNPKIGYSEITTYESTTPNTI